MKRYAKFGYAAPFRFRVILEKTQGGAKMTPPPTRAKVKVRHFSTFFSKFIPGIGKSHYFGHADFNGLHYF